MFAWIVLGCFMLPVVASDDSRNPADTESSSSNKSAKTKTTAAKSPTPAKNLVITPEREAAAMTFVRQHHPELAELLIHLKESSPKEHERAVRDLFRTSERLAQLQERDANVYELELKLWKARSRAQLLSAKLQMADSEELRHKLRGTLEEEYELQMQLLKRERDRLADRVNGLNSQIDRLTQRRNESIDSQFQKLTKTSGRPETKAKTNVKKKVVTPAGVK
jgi:hypothetical protein